MVPDGLAGDDLCPGGGEAGKNLARVLFITRIEEAFPPQSREGVTAAQLLIEGTTWTSVQVPVFCVVGRAVAVPKIEPERIRRADLLMRAIIPD